MKPEGRVICEQPFRKGRFVPGKNNGPKKGLFLVFCECGNDASVETQAHEQSWRCNRCRRVYSLVSPIEENKNGTE